MIRKLFGAALAFVALFSSGCALVSGWNQDVKSNQRLAAFPTQDLGLKARVEVLFNQNQVPFILAEDDQDLPVALGMVHAHLRLAQMETFRRVSQGRLSEVFGPFVSDVDQSLRILNLRKAVPQMLASLPPETLAWLEGFVRGVNLYIKNCKDFSPEMEILGIAPEPWTVEDILTIGRLAAVDINWLFWYNTLQVRGQKGWPELWERLQKVSRATPPSFKPESGLPAELLSGSVKSGSNCMAVTGGRSKSGGAILANDAHVGLSLPSLWLLVGYRSPSHQVLGYCIPGLPLVVMGRNAHIAWGGTNMLSLSSSLYNWSEDAPGEVKEREETIKVRWWVDKTFKVRETENGPIITDSPLFETPKGTNLVLKWRGHEPSDEATAFFKVNQAKNWQEFREAFASYAISGQNMLYADDQGNIGQVMAIEYQPAAGRTGQVMVADSSQPEYQWKDGIKSTDLPSILNPEQGLLISTNNTPVTLDPPLSLFAQASDRFYRAKEYLGERGKLDTHDFMTLQTDVYAHSSHQLAQALAKHAKPQDQAQQTLVEALNRWDGHYEVNSAGAAALELTAYHFGKAVYMPKYGKELTSYLAGSPSAYTLILEDLQTGDHETELAGALKDAAKDFTEFPAWGKMHFLRLGHMLGSIPLVGSKFRYGELPYPGSSQTLLKSAHSLSNKKHYARYGANARFIADMSSQDENYFAMLGGEDGYLGSQNFLDLFQQWKKGEYLKIPLSEDKVREEFPNRLELK